MEVIQKGAEAVIYLDGKKIIKERISKKYRINEIDEKLRKFRTKREAKILEKIKDIVPKVFDVDEKNMKITMEYIDGELLRDILDDISTNKRKDILHLLGSNIAYLHDQGIIHGDLTTSNVILKDKKLFIIDFGLGFFSDKYEDKAVDLHLIKQAFQSKHYRHAEESFGFIIEGYKRSKTFDEVMERFEKVESRGRYKGKQ